MKINKYFVLRCAAIVSIFTAGSVFAQQSGSSVDPQTLLSDLRWKSESEVRNRLGDPQSIRGPIGTHASYQLWNYEGFSVAIADNRVFHLFDESSLRKMQLEENR